MVQRAGQCIHVNEGYKKYNNKSTHHSREQPYERSQKHR